MKVQLLNAKKAGECVTNQLHSPACVDFRFAVAYARLSGVKVVAKPIESLISRKGFAEGFVGVNQGNTSYQALCMLHDVMEGRLHVRYGKRFVPSFHPKVYIWGNANKNSLWEPSTVLVGSSNLSRGGLDTNEECGCFCQKENKSTDVEFFESVREFWENTTKNQENFVNLRVDKNLLYDLLNAGALVDESKRQESSQANIDKIIQGISTIATNAIEPQHSHFVMTLSHFDTSPASSDPVILVPIRARNEDPGFWFWPFLYSRGNGTFEEYKINALVHLDGHSVSDNLRLYDYPGKSEFRLKSEIIKRNGNKKDILLAHRVNADISLKLIRQTDEQYAEYAKHLTETTSSKKRYGYFTP